MSETQQPDESGSAIAPARRAAHEVLLRTFEQGAWTDRAFAAIVARLELEGRELARARRLSYGSVQRRGTCDHLIAKLARRRRAKVSPGALAALRLGFFELLFSEAPDEYAVVDQAVHLARLGDKSIPAAGSRAATGFVNALLRRAAGERTELLAGLDDSTPAGAAVAHSYPGWLTQKWWQELGGAEARLLMAAMNEPAETAFRINTLRAHDPDRLAGDLRAAGVEVSGPGAGTLLDPTTSIVVAEAGAAIGARVATGELVPQSRGSQAAISLLDPRPGERVLDICAGPGIKTTAIAALTQNRGEVVAIEIDPRRATEIEQLCARAGASGVRVHVADAAEADLGSGYDRILLDPPCSDLGTLASRPDARWRKSLEACERLASLQRRLLVRAARALAPGGTLVYSTCTVSVPENEQVASSIGDLAPVEIENLGTVDPRLASRHDPRFLQLLPQRDRTTGFFFARFVRGDR